MGDKMNRRENKIFSELIWNDKSTVAAFKDKYNVQERSIRLAIKSINDDLMEAGLPTIFENSEGELSIDASSTLSPFIGLTLKPTSDVKPIVLLTISLKLSTS